MKSRSSHFEGPGVQLGPRRKGSRRADKERIHRENDQPPPAYKAFDDDTNNPS